MSTKYVMIVKNGLIAQMVEHWTENPCVIGSIPIQPNMEILEFIFKDFWRFLGTLLLLGAIFGNLGRIGRKTYCNCKCSKCKNYEEREK